MSNVQCCLMSFTVISPLAGEIQLAKKSHFRLSRNPQMLGKRLPIKPLTKQMRVSRQSEFLRLPEKLSFTPLYYLEKCGKMYIEYRY